MIKGLLENNYYYELKDIYDIWLLYILKNKNFKIAVFRQVKFYIVCICGWIMPLNSSIYIVALYSFWKKTLAENLLQDMLTSC